MEAQILDYQTQQYKLLPLLASAFAMYFTGRYAEDYYEEIASEIEEGKLDSLNQVRNWEDVSAVFFSVVRAYHSNPFGFPDHANHSLNVPIWAVYKEWIFLHHDMLISLASTAVAISPSNNNNIINNSTCTVSIPTKTTTTTTTLFHVTNVNILHSI